MIDLSFVALALLFLFLGGAASAAAGLGVLLYRQTQAFREQASIRLQQTACWHADMLVADPQRIFLRCSICGRETSGIAVGDEMPWWSAR